MATESFTEISPCSYVVYLVPVPRLELSSMKLISKDVPSKSLSPRHGHPRVKRKGRMLVARCVVPPAVMHHADTREGEGSSGSALALSFILVSLRTIRNIFSGGFSKALYRSTQRFYDIHFFTQRHFSCNLI